MGPPLGCFFNGQTAIVGEVSAFGEPPRRTWTDMLKTDAIIIENRSHLQSSENRPATAFFVPFALSQ
jgi:hypothetical protein